MMTQTTTQTQKTGVVISTESLERYIRQEEKLNILRRMVETELKNEYPNLSCKTIMMILG